MKALLIALGGLIIAPFAAATEIKVSFSEDAVESFEDDYGIKEMETLSEYLTDKVSNQLEAKGVAPHTIELTIEKVRPNRPTFQQMSDTPGLDFSSFGTGGADISGRVLDADGTLILELQYDWFESDIRFAQGKTTWADTRQTIRRYARKLANALEAEQAGAAS